MNADNFRLEDYFRRIGYAGPVRRDMASVTALMERQLFTVPFENLDVQAGKVPSLVPEDIVDKIVRRRRGGYCYEVNGLFAMALHALGVDYDFVAARPMIYPVRRPRTHMALVVHLEGEWLCDLGFGSHGPRAPISLDEPDVELAQGHDRYRLSRSGGDYLLQAKLDGEWANQYAFNRCPQEWVDFAPANWLNATHPDALFVQKPVVVIHTTEGRRMLVGDTFKEVRCGASEKRNVATEEMPALLREQFGL